MDGQAPDPLDKKKKLLIATGAGLAVAALIVVGAVLPAEFNKDPLGVGKLTGVARLWAPKENKIDPNAGSVKRARFYATPFRSDVIEIPLTGPGGGYQGQELEYKVRMLKDATLIYSWEVVGAKRDDDLRYDFHGHTLPTREHPVMDVASYRADYGQRGQGALTAPFNGIHGWQFSNTTDRPLVVRVRLAGFYTLIEQGDAGNEAGIVADVPAAQARPWLTNHTPDPKDLAPLPPPKP